MGQLDLSYGNAALVETLQNANPATIKHVRSGGFAYDVICVTDHTKIDKVTGPGLASDGVVDRLSAREMAASVGKSVIVNSDGWRNASGTAGFSNTSARPAGLNIIDGVLYQDWLSSESRTQAVVMMDDGTLLRADKDDGKTGAQWVTDGARWSATWGVWVVEAGAAVANVNASYAGGSQSGRTVIGRKVTGEILLILIEGKTGGYGATPADCGTIALAEGCQVAYVMDGGGSSQCWWKNTYAVPSSDESSDFPEERPIPTGIAISGPVADYDSGMVELSLSSGNPAMASAGSACFVRHIGPNIHASVRISRTLASDASATIMPNDTIPRRYTPTFDGLMRFPAMGSSGRAMSVYSGSSRSFSVRNISNGSTSYIAGSGTWPAQFTDI